MNRLFISFVALIITCIPSIVVAQGANGIRPSQQVFDNSSIANPNFDAMVRQAMMHMNEDFKFGRFRSLYIDTSQYDPIADGIINEMQSLAFKVQNGKDSRERAKAIDDYRNLVMEHMANIRVVAQAISFTKIDGTFGSTRFFEWIRKGLVRDILRHGDGKTLKTAYEVATLTEETVLIGQLGFSVIDTQSANEGYLYYNMHEVEDLKTGQKNTLFINTTRPMRFLNSQEQSVVQGFSILRQ